MRNQNASPQLLTASLPGTSPFNAGGDEARVTPLVHAGGSEVGNLAADDANDV
jgi:hypothetical protein